MHEIGEPQDPQFFQLLGMFLSDTNGNASAIQLDTCLAGTAASDDFARYISNVWGEQPDEFASRVASEIITMAVNSDESSTITAPLTHRRLLSRMTAFVRTEAGQRRLSDEAFTAGLAAQKHLLRGLFTTDSIITNNNSVELQNRSLGLLRDVQLILLGFGVQSALIEKNDGGAVASGEMFDRQVCTTPLGRDLVSRDANPAPRLAYRLGQSPLFLYSRRIDPR